MSLSGGSTLNTFSAPRSVQTRLLNCSITPLAMSTPNHNGMVCVERMHSVSEHSLNSDSNASSTEHDTNQKQTDWRAQGLEEGIHGAGASSGGAASAGDEAATGTGTGAGKASKKKSANSKYPWVEEAHFVKDVYQFFDIERELGRGASCRVLKVKEKKTGSTFAMKEMRRDDKWNPMLFEQEVNILGKLSGHKNILHYEDCWVDAKNFYVLTSLCTGGELFGTPYALPICCEFAYNFSQTRSRSCGTSASGTRRT